jgi:microcystin-dependent protein
MLKRFFLSLALTLGLIAPSFGSGTIPFSLSQQLDNFGQPLAGCLFYTIQAGTTSTPQNAYQDSALTIPLPNPQTCDAAGRLPQMFLADGTIKVRLTDKNGVTILVADNIQVVGASSGSGGGGTVDPTTILSTGDLKVTYGTGVLAGFVRANGRTIGSATSGATERANADCQALFEYLWNADPNLTVSTGRGVSAAADWSANKTITLPDWRGRAIAGLADMGNTATSTLTSTYFGSDPTVLGQVGGAQSHTLTAAELPTSIPASASVTLSPSNQVASVVSVGVSVPGSQSALVPAGGSLTASASVSVGGSGNAHSIVPPEMLATIYLKL